MLLPWDHMGLSVQNEQESLLQNPTILKVEEWAHLSRSSQFSTFEYELLNKSSCHLSTEMYFLSPLPYLSD